MTVDDAICKIKHRIAIDRFDGEDPEDLKLAIQALEKQTPAKVIYDEFPSGYRLYKCPVCGMTAIYGWCFGCGQALDLTEMHEWQKPIIEEMANSCDWSRNCYSFIQPKGDKYMGDKMYFPETIDDFLEGFSFKDTDEIYTNGAMLIPVFRVKQALEHYNQKIRNKTIDEFAGLLIDILESWAELDRMAFGIHGDGHGYLITVEAYDRVINLINEMAEDTKGESAE